MRWPRLAEGSFGRGVVTLASGTAGVQALYLVCLPLLTRLYSVEQVGDLTVFQALLAVLLVVSALRYEVAIFVSSDDREAINLLALAAVVVVLSSLATAAVLAGVPALASLPGRYSVLTRNWGWLWLAQVGAGLALALTQWTLRRRSYATVATARVSQVSSQLGTQLLLGLVWPGGGGLIAGDAAGRLAGCAVLARRLFRVDRALLGEIKKARVAKAAREYADYAVYSAPGALLNTATLQLPPIMLMFMFGSQVAGWFGLMIRVSSAPMMLIGKSVSDAYASEFSRLIRENPGALKGLFLSTFRRLALIGLLPLVVMSVAGPWLFHLVFGAAWREAGVYGRCAAIYVFAEFCCFPLFLTLSLLKKQRVQLAWDATLVALLVLGLPAVWFLGGGPRVAVLYYGICFGLMYFVHVWLSYRMLGAVAQPTAT